MEWGCEEGESRREWRGGKDDVRAGREGGDEARGQKKAVTALTNTEGVPEWSATRRHGYEKNLPAPLLEGGGRRGPFNAIKVVECYTQTNHQCYRDGHRQKSHSGTTMDVFQNKHFHAWRVVHMNKTRSCNPVVERLHLFAPESPSAFISTPTRPR
jgi:hypothetical protein